uniref:Putative zinc finger protein At4g06634 n=1 Tax=Anthurium amnicola TaxID=1678845 RepID=A0A1D1Z853_9ARAE
MEEMAAPILALANYPVAPFEERPGTREAVPAVRWVKEWVPQDLIATGGKCMVLRWVREDMLKAMQEKLQEPEAEEPEPEPTTEVLFLCSFEGCGKTFIDVAALRKHSHVHGEKQYICHYDGCGKKFLDSSKLKRHFLIHTGERAYMCSYEGCGKAFSLDFNLRAHMRTHSQENYHICPHEDCGKRFAHLYKLQAHIKAQHEKNTAMNMVRHAPVEEKVHVAPKPAAAIYSDRPYACPYEGCGKSYIHEYKLKLHLRREHPGHNLENGKRTPVVEHDTEDASEQDAHIGKAVPSKASKRNKSTAPSTKAPPSKIARKASTSTTTNLNVAKKQWPATKEMYEEDSEETEEDCENAEEDGWRYQGVNGDDEETEDEE